MIKRSILLEMRKLAKDELLAYRRNQTKLSAHALTGDARTHALGWASAIERARALLQREMPEKERAMTRLFGLDTPVPRYQKTRARVIRLCMDLNVAEATLYKWREDIVLLVLGAAIEEGLIRPFREHEQNPPTGGCGGGK